MDRASAESLMAIWKRLETAFEDAILATRMIPEDDERTKLLRSLTSAVASVIVGFRAPIVRAYPDLDATDESPEPDPHLNSEQQSRVDRLTGAEVAAIDDALVEDCCDQWRKVARIVGSALGK